MCYRASTPNKKALAELLGREVWVNDYKAHYHTSGFDHPDLPVMLSSDQKSVQPVIWGFVPENSTNEDAVKFFKSAYSLNAKAETIFTVPMYRNVAPHKRCLIFVDGFFEWKHTGSGKIMDKVPYYIQMPDHKPFALGGLWSERDGEKHCNILTTVANELMTTIHNSKKRMPFIVPEVAWETWLNINATIDAVQQIIHPFPEGYLEAHEISRMITKKGVEKDVAAVQEAV